MNYKRSPCLFNFLGKFLKKQIIYIYIYLFIIYRKGLNTKQTLKDLKRSSIQNQQYDKISEIKNEIQNINRSQKKRKKRLSPGLII